VFLFKRISNVGKWINPQVDECSVSSTSNLKLQHCYKDFKILVYRSNYIIWLLDKNIFLKGRVT